MTSKYTGVQVSKTAKGKIRYRAIFRPVEGRSQTKVYDNERDAAKAYDLMLIKAGKDPVNILKRQGI